MKKLFVIMVVLTAVSVYGQESVKVSVNGDVSYFSKNLSTFTGLMFSEEPAMVAHMNTTLEAKDFTLSAAYSGQLGIHHVTDGDRFNMLDLSIGYKLRDEITACMGYELTYSENIEKKDEIGHGIFAMVNYSKGSISSNIIFFSDPTFKSTYYIGSTDINVGKNVSVYLLGGYTNTKSTPWYGLVGLRYCKSNLFIETDFLLDNENSGPVVSIGLRFK